MQSCQRREISSRCWRQETEGCDLQKSEFLEATRCHQPLSERVRVPNRSPQLTTKTWGLFWLVDFFFRLEGCFGVWKIRTLPFWDPTCTFFFFRFLCMFFFLCYQCSDIGVLFVAFSPVFFPGGSRSRFGICYALCGGGFWQEIRVLSGKPGLQVAAAMGWDGAVGYKHRMHIIKST